MRSSVGKHTISLEHIRLARFRLGISRICDEYFGGNQVPFLFCNITWMREYKGHHRIDMQPDDPPERGGAHVDTYGTAHECCNFLPSKDGLIYGHVETFRGKRDTEINIDNLNYKNSGYIPGDPYIDGIDVIWTATHQAGGKRVVGWYRNARVYRIRQHHKNRFPTKQHKKDTVNSYRIIAGEKDTYCFAEDQRYLKLDPKNKKKGWPGENSIFYPSKHEDNKDLNKFLVQLNAEINGNTENYLSAPDLSVEYWDLEGGTQLKRHITKERSRKLIRDFKAQLANYSCSICGFSFEEKYGPIGRDFIEAHHTIPIATLSEKTRMLAKDLIAVCSNCHRMLHRANPPLTSDALQSEINRNQL